MINVNSTVKLTLASVVTLNISLRYNNAHTAVIVTLSTPDHLWANTWKLPFKPWKGLLIIILFLLLSPC